jgi:hypothetical protein
MAIWGCGSPARCCQPSVSGGFIYTDLRSELNTPLAPQAPLAPLGVLLGATTTATSFPLSKLTGGGDTASALSGWRVYLQLMWEVGLPPSPVEFSSLCHFYKLSRSWLLGVCCRSCLLQLACEGFPIPPLLCSGRPALFAMCLFCCYSLLFSFFSLFSLGGGWSVQGLCWSGPGLSVGVPRTA